MLKDGEGAYDPNVDGKVDDTSLEEFRRQFEDTTVDRDTINSQDNRFALWKCKRDHHYRAKVQSRSGCRGRKPTGCQKCYNIGNREEEYVQLEDRWLEDFVEVMRKG